MSTCVVITTIMPPSAAVLDHCRRGADVIVVADRKTPVAEYERVAADFPNLHVLTLERQQAIAPRLAALLPVNHYTRKNVGYVQAFRGGHAAVFDTDDDNLYRGPASFGTSCGAHTRVQCAAPGGVAYFNVYSLYTPTHLWPRGYPLERVRARDSGCAVGQATGGTAIAVWQGMVDGDPDVDAIARLTSEAAGTDFAFEAGERRVVLDRGVLCPFNAQNVWWTDAAAYDLMYLPHTVTMRVCDILRSYVAQHCLWARGARVGFTEPTAFQARNAHDLLRDFDDETALYLHASEMNAVLHDAAASFTGDAGDLRRAYAGLAATGFVKPAELEAVDAWLEHWQ